jgi:hypothetical protein
MIIDAPPLDCHRFGGGTLNPNLEEMPMGTSRVRAGSLSADRISILPRIDTEGSAVVAEVYEIVGGKVKATFNVAVRMAVAVETDSVVMKWRGFENPFVTRDHFLKFRIDCDDL